jgi:hypothetical protein
MGNAPSERENDGRLSQGGPQDGPIGGRDDKRHADPDNADVNATGGIGAGVEGQGGQRSAGSSRDTDARHREEAK